MTSHDMVQVEEICDSATIMSAGRVAAAGRLDAITGPGYRELINPLSLIDGCFDTT